LFEANITKETRKKKVKKDDQKKYQFAYERVLIETMIKQHKKNKIKKMKKVVQKKKHLRQNKMISIEKKRIHMKKMISQKKKRKETRIIKMFEKTSKLKRVYRRPLSHSSISKQKSSISVQTWTILKNSIFSMKKIEVQNFTSLCTRRNDVN
jgi:hypothetical protein